MIALLFLYFSRLLVCCNARRGVDLSFSFTPNELAQFLPSKQVSSSFGIFHIMFYNGTINLPAINSIKSAWSHGIRDISVYMYLCIPDSAFSVDQLKNRGNGLQTNSSSMATYCSAPEEQILELNNTLALHGIYFRDLSYNYLSQSYGSRNLSFSASSISSSKIMVQTLFINVEDNVPSYYFSLNSTANVLYLKRVVELCQSIGIEVGIYTTKVDWYNIMTSLVISHHNNLKANAYLYDSLDFQNSVTAVSDPIMLTNVTNPFRQLKLWTPRYDNIYSMDFYSSFGDWNVPYVKQLSGGTTDLRRIGSGRVCLNYIH
jgi:hypothetical protein